MMVSIGIQMALAYWITGEHDRPAEPMRIFIFAVFSMERVVAGLHEAGDAKGHAQAHPQPEGERLPGMELLHVAPEYGLTRTLMAEDAHTQAQVHSRAGA